MQQQFMQMSEFADGTIMKNIEFINKQLSDRFMIELDLREKLVVKVTNTEEAFQNVEEGRLKAKQQQLDEYCQNFMVLNKDNKEILDESLNNHLDHSKKQIEVLMRKFEIGMDELRGVIKQKDDTQVMRDQEVFKQVNQIHYEFQKAEEKRIKDFGSLADQVEKTKNTSKLI